MVVYSDRKVEYFERLRNNLTNFSRLFIVQADNVGSLQMQQIRAALRGKAEVMMGKNTMMRRCIRDMENETFNQLLPLIIGNIGLVFTNEDLGDIRSIIMENKVPAPARAGAIAQCDVVVPAGNTGMEPTKTSFFQALGIATKITRGTVEIISDHHLITCGDKVDQSQAELLKVMNIRPFSYGLLVDKVFDNGQIYDASVLDITDEIMTGFFSSGITNIACVSLQTGYPTVASLPHSILHGFKNLLAIAAATEVTFKEAEQVKAFLADPSAFVVAAAPAAGGAAAAAPAAEEEEEEEEEDDDMGFGLFD